MFLNNQKNEAESKIRIDTQNLKSKTSERESIEVQLKDVRAKLMQFQQTFENSDYRKLTEKLQNSINKLEIDKIAEESRKEQLINYLRFLTNYLSLFKK